MFKIREGKHSEPLGKDGSVFTDQPNAFVGLKIDTPVGCVEGRMLGEQITCRTGDSGMVGHVVLHGLRMLIEVRQHQHVAVVTSAAERQYVHIVGPHWLKEGEVVQ